MGFRSEHCALQLISNGFWAYYSAETARDMLLRKRPKRVNILTNADLLQISKLFSDVHFRNGHGESAYLVHEDLQICFFISDYPVETAVKIPGMLDLEKEALRRAAYHELFRVNSFFYDIKRDRFHDLLDSYTQLKRGFIQTVTDAAEAARRYPTIALKTAKLLSETGFVIDERLRSFLKEQRDTTVYRHSIEGMVADFVDTVNSKYAEAALSLLDEWGVLKPLLPELVRLKEVYHDKDHHPEGNAFTHTLRCLACVKEPNKNLMMAILLHDIGKATTMNNGNGFRFPNHAHESMKIADRVLRRLYFNEKDREEVLYLIRNHMMINGIEKRPESFQNKFFSSPYFPNLLELYRADVESTYTHVNNYYQVARLYRKMMRKMKFQQQGVYSS
jgi:tRNA nucleotidyltransferase/poly(A) polymerase